MIFQKHQKVLLWSKGLCTKTLKYIHLHRWMDSSILSDIVKFWMVHYFDGVTCYEFQIVYFQNVYLSLKIVSTLATSVEPDKTLPSAAPHVGLHCSITQE